MYTMEQGLSGFNCSELTVDHNGFLWIGSVTGLQVYDGNTFYTIPCGRGKKMLRGNKVRCLVMMDSVFILAGTDQGISKINTNSYETQNLLFPAELSKSQKANLVQQIYKSNFGYYWVVCATSVYKVSPDLQVLRIFNFPDSLFNRSEYLQPYRVCEFPDKSIWISGPRIQETTASKQLSIFKINPEHQEMQPLDSIPFTDYSRFLSFVQINDSLNFVLYETVCNDVNLILFNLKKKSQYFIPHRRFIYENTIPFISVLNSDQIGINTIGLGDYLIYNLSSRYLYSEKIYPAVNIKSVLQYNGSLFAATDKGMLRTSPITSIFKPNECVSIFKDFYTMPMHVVETNQAIYTSLKHNGVSVFNKESQSCSLFKPISPLEPNTQIGKFYLLDSTHWLICGNTSFVYEPKTNKSYKISKPNQEPYAFEYLTSKTYKDSQNEFWYGTIHGNGIFRYNYSTGKVIHYSLENINRNAQFKTFDAITEDRSGNLWFASVLGSGILKWTRKTNKFNIIYSENKVNKSFPSCISDMTTDSSGMIWFGTQGYGVYKLDPERIEFIDFSNAMNLPNSYIHSLTLDCRGNLWGTCLIGLFTFNPSTNKCYFFNKFHGLFNNNNYNIAPIAGNECMLYLCSNKNLQYIHANTFKIPDPIPAIYLRSIKVNNNEKEPSESYTLEYNENNLEIQFAQANLIDGFLNKYYYRYVGKDTSWTYFGKNPVLHLAGIGYGNYSLQIKVCQNGNACFHDTILQFKVNRPFWKSPWYYSILGLLIVSFLLYIVVSNYRLKYAKMEKERDKEILRNKIAQDIHDEVGSSLTKIILSAQVAARISGLSQEDLKMRLSHVAKDAKIASSQLRELVFSINPDFDHFEDMQAYFQEHARFYLEDANIQLFFTLPKSNANELVHPDIKRQLLLIYKELLNNILKHASAKNVWIRLEEFENKNYLLEIKDDGKGFDPAHSGKTSTGMRGLVQRANSLSATVNIDSKPGSGTVIQINGSLKFKLEN